MQSSLAPINASLAGLQRQTTQLPDGLLSSFYLKVSTPSKQTFKTEEIKCLMPLKNS
jgi:hypothetical protein